MRFIAAYPRSRNWKLMGMYTLVFALLMTPAKKGAE